MEKISLKDAREAGLKRYFTGLPCARGHVSERTVSGRGCLVCAAENYRENSKKIISRSAEWKMANRERVKELARQRRAADPVAAREKERLVRPKYAIKKIAQVKAWRDENLDRHKANQSEWASQNRPKMAAYSSKRRALIRGVENTLTGEDIEAIKTLQKNRCAYCKAKKKLTVDHIQPISKGGGNVRKNIQMLCKNCNSQKHATHPIEFAQKIGLLL